MKTILIKIKYRAAAGPARERPLAASLKASTLVHASSLHTPETQTVRVRLHRLARASPPKRDHVQLATPSLFQIFIYFSTPVSRDSVTTCDCVRRASDCGMRVGVRSRDRTRSPRDRHEISPRDRTATSWPVRLGRPRPETIFTTDIASGVGPPARTASLRAARVIVGCP